MSFVDEISISARAGNGGNGVVRWLHEKGKEFGGPSGGNGGRGGTVIFRAIRDINKLARYKGRSEFKAERGDDGGSKNMYGKAGESLVIEVPVGSVITPRSSKRSFELLSDGEEVIALHGGNGGRGNTEFKSSTNQYPTQSTPGTAGEADAFKIEVKIIADVGLIGLPNAGKTSLLNALTNAGAKVGEYAFTTLDPNLGAFFGFIVADIPGLIEGASQGKGLGDKFLRHVSRTRLLIHCVSSELADPIQSYETIREELKSYDPSLLEKEEIVVLTKSDTVSDEQLEKLKVVFSKKSRAVMTVSVLDDATVKMLSDSLSKKLSEKIESKSDGLKK
jgi:GTP-binding protein